MNILDISKYRWYMVLTLSGGLLFAWSLFHVVKETYAFRFIGAGLLMLGIGIWRDYETPFSATIGSTGKVISSTARFNMGVFLLKMSGSILLVLGIWKILHI